MDRALNRGALLRYKGFEETPSVKILHVMLPGHREYDGAMPGVAFKWLKRPRRGSYFFPCQSLDQFFAHELFANLEII